MSKQKTKENNVTFTGTEAKVLTVSQLNKLLSSISDVKGDEENPVHHIAHNGCNEFFDTYFHAVRPSSMGSLYDMTVHERKYVPLGEIWMVDKHGRVLRKIKWTK